MANMRADRLQDRTKRVNPAANVDAHPFTDGAQSAAHSQPAMAGRVARFGCYRGRGGTSSASGPAPSGRGAGKEGGRSQKTRRGAQEGRSRAKDWNKGPRPGNETTGYFHVDIHDWWLRWCWGTSWTRCQSQRFNKGSSWEWHRARAARARQGLGMNGSRPPLCKSSTRSKRYLRTTKPRLNHVHVCSLPHSSG